MQNVLAGSVGQASVCVCVCEGGEEKEEEGGEGE